MPRYQVSELSRLRHPRYDETYLHVCQADAPSKSPKERTMQMWSVCERSQGHVSYSISRAFLPAVGPQQCRTPQVGDATVPSCLT